jgi:SAM-dependent methyltransferase
MTLPQTWHYGLVALYWAEFNRDGGPEAAYFQSLIEASGQPALDLGCGSGRLLLPYVQAGLDVDGCDYSQDMLAQCQARAAQEGLSVQLYHQAIHELDLPRRYRTIVACGVLGLGGERRLTLQAMRRCYEHLRPGGTFAFDYEPLWNDPPAWLERLPEGRHALPQEWPAAEERQRLADGSELELVTRTIAVDPSAAVATHQIRARRWKDGELLEEEVHTLKLEDYGMHELVLMLERAGFGDITDITITGDYGDEPATADHHFLVFVARK